MAKSIVFLIHGVGIHEDGWSRAEDGPVPALSRAAEYYPGFSETDPLSGAVEFVEIRYDDVFDGIRQQWADLAEALGSGNLPGATPQVLENIAGVLEQAGGDNRLATHVLDVGMYTGFRIVQRLVQLKVASLMMKTIAEHVDEEEGSRYYFIIAHSLGTTIAHDAIQRMATTGWLSQSDRMRDLVGDSGFTIDDFEDAVERYGRNPFAPGNFKFDGLFQIANTSRLLTRTKPAYQSCVRPMFSSGPLTTSVRRFYNIDHVLDPVGKFRRHRAAEAWPDAAMHHTAVDLFDIEHVHDLNVHGFGHYLSHPVVHAHLLGALAPGRFKAVDFETAKGRVAEGGDFPRFGTGFGDEDVRTDVESVLASLSPNTLASLPDWIEPQVRQYLGGLEVPANVRSWLGTTVAFKQALGELREKLR